MTFKRTSRIFLNAFHNFNKDNCPSMAAGISYYVLFSIVPLAVFLVSAFGLIIRDDGVRLDITDKMVEALGIQEGEPQIELRPEIASRKYSLETARDIRLALIGMSDGEKRALAGDLRARRPFVTVNDETFSADSFLLSYDNAISEALRGVAASSGALSILGLIAVIWSASAMFGALRKALSIVWQAEQHRPFVQQKLLDLAMVAVLGLLALLSVAGTAALRAARELSDDAFRPLSTSTDFFWSVVPFFFPALITFLLFVVLYRIVPAKRVELKHIWPAALVATVLFEVLKNGFAMYVANFSSYDAVYGSLGGVLLFLTGVYFAANILLFGAELAAEMPRAAAPDYVVARPKLPEKRTLKSILRGLGRKLKGLVFEEKPKSPPSNESTNP